MATVPTGPSKAHYKSQSDYKNPGVPSDPPLCDAACHARVHRLEHFWNDTGWGRFALQILRGLGSSKFDPVWSPFVDPTQGPWRNYFPHDTYA
jgi:hypothetical protein